MRGEERRRVPSCSCCVQHEEKLIKGQARRSQARWEVRLSCTAEAFTSSSGLIIALRN